MADPVGHCLMRPELVSIEKNMNKNKRILNLYERKQAHIKPNNQYELEQIVFLQLDQCRQKGNNNNFAQSMGCPGLMKRLLKFKCKIFISI